MSIEISIIKDLENYSIILYNNAIASLKKRNITEATEYLKNSLVLNNKDVDILNLLGICFYKNCDFNEAKFVWEESLKIKSSCNRAITYLNYLNLKETEEMIKQYSNALNCIVDSKLDMSIELLNRVIKFDNELIEPYIVISLIYAKKRKFKKSNKYISKAIKFDTGNERAHKYQRAIKKKKFNFFNSR